MLLRSGVPIPPPMSTPECHATSTIDGLLAKLSGVMPQGVVRKRITTVEEAKQVFSEASAEQHEFFTDAAKGQ